MNESIPEDSEREDHITMEIVVDAYGPDETRTGWYCYLENTMTFPFTARWKRASERADRPPKVVKVTGLSDEDECRSSIRAEVEESDEHLADVALSKLTPIDADAKTSEAVADWHYWVARGYCW